MLECLEQLEFVVHDKLKETEEKETEQEKDQDGVERLFLFLDFALQDCVRELRVLLLGGAPLERRTVSVANYRY